MKLFIIRHGDPDYTIDSLTEKGRKEAALLAERLKNVKIDHFYVSPLGRAQATAKYTLDAMGRTAETCPWLREFDAHVKDIHTGEERIPWDMLPEDWTKIADYYDKDKWYDVPQMAEGHVIDEAKKVYDGIDGILARHGYERDGNIYKAVRTQQGDCCAVLPFRRGVRYAGAFAGSISHGAVARILCGSHIGNCAYQRGTP